MVDGSSSSSSNDAAADKCPVDHKSREVWLQQARAAQEAGAPPPPMPPHPIPASASSLPPPPTSSSPGSSSSWNPLSWRVPFWHSTTASQTTLESQAPRPAARPQLDEHRVVSSIPRSSASPGQPTGSAPPPPSRPVNHEIETGADPHTGNWIYPSEKMFFEALKRKGTAGDTRPVDMRTVVPIHNAVNERAWKEIKEWEAPYLDGAGGGGNKCGGPKLESFSGLAAKMTPRARINTLLGYTAPFDRHDWVVDRCGKKIEYVIDFYAGRPGAAQQQQQGPQINFYLDVRPKLNSWEGVKMRALRFVGAT